MKYNSKYCAKKWIHLSVFLFSAYFLLRYAAGILFPFIIALCVGAIVYPLSQKLSKLTHLPRKLCAVFILLLFLALIGFFIFFASVMLIKELRLLAARVSDESDPIGMNVRYIFEAMSDPASDKIASVLSDSLKQMILSLFSSVSSLAARVASAAPRVIITVVITVTSCFYTSFDLDKIKELSFSLFKKNIAKDILQKISFALKAYAKAYLFLFIMTFFEILTGLLILRRPYAFLVALLIAAVDILPVFGAGSVLIPWTVFLFISKQYSIGCGILILYGTVTVIRQIAEPHLVGKGLRIHPLSSLFFMYAGFKLLGVKGLIIAPALALIAKECILSKGTDTFSPKN